MQKENIHTAKEKKINETYFTGNVVIREILGEGNSAEQEMYHVIFQNGALTTLHYHESDQILIATNGKGVVGLIHGSSLTKFEIDDDNDMIFFKKEGDTVCIPANTLHFHGAIIGETFSHIAIMKKFKINGENAGRAIKKAENKWEYDLISEEIGNKDPESIKRIAKEIAEKIQIAISKKL
ncbi:MAG TPA: cupin domain-containing protein [Nitrososphaeraceae archaeon]|nr:cupin domain-containing protein [Nitrososphaeraceae archaeon]